ncbi:uncharacterized protein LOC114517324 [Dendronephthya gigantea]|uniref:uncharacterized protein LOC114517324 n=1 Tax=Dendronephthya gigantea TaxID=151771 RepID=UPI00106A50EF|nr:uncharacterized protein LOC114517324 [Dendronephthya gigantea]
MKTAPIVAANTQIGVLLIGTGFVGYFFKELRDYNSGNSILTDDDAYDRGAYGRFEFYLFSTCIGVIISVLSILGAATGIVGKMGAGLAMAAVHALWALQLLVSTALMAKVLATYEENVFQCETWEALKLDLNCKHLIGGVVCGFIGAVIFMVNTVVYLFWSRKSTE